MGKVEDGSGATVGGDTRDDGIGGKSTSGLGRRSEEGLAEAWLLGVASAVSWPWLCSGVLGGARREGVLWHFLGAAFSLSLPSSSLSSLELLTSSLSSSSVLSALIVSASES